MMVWMGTCPSCHKSITTEHFYSGSYFCPCGWSSRSQRQRVRNYGVGFASMGLIAFTLILLSGFWYLMKWDTYGAEVAGIQTKILLNTAEKQDLLKMAYICRVRKNTDCEETSLKQAYMTAPSSPEVAAATARFLTQNGKNGEALGYFAAYFQNNGRDGEVAYLYGQALEKTGYTKSALRYYHYGLKAKAGSLDARSARAYTNLLMKEGQWRSARNVILSIRSQSQSASLFMEKELEKIDQKLAVALRF